jgi:seipin
MKNSPWSHHLCGEESTYQSSSPSGEYACASNDHETISYSVGEEKNESVVENPILAPGQRYFFELVLTLPESDINKQLGVFMVKVELRSVDRTLLASSKQHSMLPYESSIVTLFRKTMLILPLAFGLMSETKSVTLLLFDHYTDISDKKPVSLVEVTLGVPNPAAFPTTLQTIQIHSAELRYGKEMNAIQSLLRHWQYLFAIIVISAYCRLSCRY